MGVQRMGVVYRYCTYGDPELTGAVKNGMDVASVPVKELAVVKEKNKWLTAEKGVRAANDAEKWPDIQARLARQYRVKQHGIVYHKVLLAWALMWFEIGRFYERMAAWNREA